MGLKELYESWQFKPGNMLGNNKTPREQSEGKVAVDFMPNTYQAQVQNRLPGDRIVLQSPDTDTTKGTFNTVTAFKHYSSLILDTFLIKYPRVGMGKIVHRYNAQGTDQDKYHTNDAIKNTPGALYNTNS